MRRGLKGTIISFTDKHYTIRDDNNHEERLLPHSVAHMLAQAFHGNRVSKEFFTEVDEDVTLSFFTGSQYCWPLTNC